MNSREIIKRILCRIDDELPAEAVERIFAATVHDGDCTKQAHTCLVCLAETYAENAEIFERALAEAGLQIRPVEPSETMVKAGIVAWDGAVLSSFLEDKPPLVFKAMNTAYEEPTE